MIYLDIEQHRLYLVSLELLYVGPRKLLLLPQYSDPYQATKNKTLKMGNTKFSVSF